MKMDVSFVYTHVYIIAQIIILHVISLFKKDIVMNILPTRTGSDILSFIL